MDRYAVQSKIDSKIDKQTKNNYNALQNEDVIGQVLGELAN